MEDHSFAVLGDKVRQLAKENDAAGIRELCGRGVTAGKADLGGQTALHIGALWGSAEAVQALLDWQADPNKTDKMTGAAPLHSAASGRGPPDKRAECIKILLAGIANPYQTDINGVLPVERADDEVVMRALGAAPLILHHAVRARSCVALSGALTEVHAEENLILPDRAPSTLDDVNPNGETALHVAAALAWREGVESLLISRASALAENKQQKSPLHVAVLSGCLHSVSLLIKARANVDAQDREMDLASRYKSTTFKEDPHSHRSPLHYAAELGNVLMAKHLLDAKAQPNRKDSKLMTPLHLCIAARKNEQAKLERGSGVRTCGVLEKPEWNGQLGSIMGDRLPGAAETADDSPGEGGRWPVMLAEVAEEGVLLEEDNLARTSDEMVDLLIVARADVNLGNQVMGVTRTCLHQAARLGDTVLLHKIVSAKADLNHADTKLGMTALHLAARSNHHDVIRILVEADADLRMATSRGRTAAELAETNGASPATLALLRGFEVPASCTKEIEEKQTLENLSAEQRALLFLD